jgi:hypothetical protein
MGHHRQSAGCGIFTNELHVETPLVVRTSGSLILHIGPIMGQLYTFCENLVAEIEHTTIKMAVRCRDGEAVEPAGDQFEYRAVRKSAAAMTELLSSQASHPAKFIFCSPVTAPCRGVMALLAAGSVGERGGSPVLQMSIFSAISIGRERRSHAGYVQPGLGRLRGRPRHRSIAVDGACSRHRSTMG